MSNEKSIQEALAEGVIILDGAMGTEIYRRNVLTNRSYDELCLVDPNLIKSIHRDYVDAGADVLTTNTFGANRYGLAAYGLAEQVEPINAAGVTLAREIAAEADRKVYVAGSVGPVRTKRPRPREELRDALTEQVRCLVTAGVDFVAFETQPNRDALELCAEVMKTFADFPFILSATVFDDGESGEGEPLERLLAPLPDDLPKPVAWALNCGTGPDPLLTTVERALRLIDRPLLVQPNAGSPKEVGGRHIYFCTPDYIAGYAKRYLELGVRGIGGCCGTTPDHIREIAQRIKPLVNVEVRKVKVELAEGVEPTEPTPLADRSRFASRLTQGRWVTTVEILPPRGYDLTDTIAKARYLYRNGVDALNLPDGPRASSRLSPLFTALRVQQEAQIEVILHFCCRDKNLIGMQADLLACAAANVRNLLIVTGDPPKLGNYPFATGVFDVDSIGLCAIQRQLNQGIDIGGQAIRPATEAVIGVGADPTALDQDREERRFRAKVENGAEFAITQPVFDRDALLRFLDRVADLAIPVVAGIWPLASLRNASFLQNEVPGVTIPESIMDRMAAHENKDDQRRTGIEIAREMVESVRERIAGIQVSAPFGNVNTALQVIAD